jgi:hypothetical protein
MRLRTLRDACLGGFLYGGLLYGSVLSLVHVLHNRLGSVRDALITFAAFLLLYGLWAAVFFGLGALVPRRGALVGLFAFNLVFWELYFLYGLTYDQAPFGPPSGSAGMMALLVLLAALIAVAVGAASWGLLRLFQALHRRHRLGRAAAAVFLLGLLAHGLVPLSFEEAPGPAPARTAAAQPRIAVTDNGLKVVLVGLDGADWRVLRPMMEKGALPVFSRLVREGSAGDLATLPDSNSSVIWASMYTGVGPDRHGVLDFYRIQLPGMASAGLFPVHRTYFKELTDLLAPLGLARQIPVDRFSLADPPVWEIADTAGLTLGLVDGYFYSFPALRPSRPESWFLSYGLDALGPRASGRLELFAQPKQLFRQIRPLLRGGDFYWQSATLLKLLAERPQPRFVNLYTHEPDSVQHFTWKWYEPQYYLGVDERERAEKGNRIPQLHRDFDRFLGQLLAEADPNTVVIVASDHGHSPTIVHSLYTQHRHGPPGVLLMRGGPVKPGHTLEGADIYDLHPTLLYLLGLPVPEDAAGAVLVDALDPEFVRRHPVRTIPTYRNLGFSPRLPGATRDGAMNQHEIDKLRALGYIF